MSRKFPIFSFCILQLVLFPSNFVQSFNAPYLKIGQECEYSEQCLLSEEMEWELKDIPFSERELKGACHIAKKICCDMERDEGCIHLSRAVIGTSCQSDIECRHIPGICGDNQTCICDSKTSFPSSQGIRSTCTCSAGLERRSRGDDCWEFSVDNGQNNIRQLCGEGEEFDGRRNCVAMRATCRGEINPGIRDGYCGKSCKARDPYGNEWTAATNSMAWNVCPFGYPYYNAKWFCGKDALFNETLPDYTGCTSDWVKDVLNQVDRPPHLEFETAKHLCSEITQKMKSALSNPDGNNTFNIYGHELAPLLGGLKTIAGKFVVNNTVPRDNLKLSDSILTCVGAILRHEQPWKYQDEEMKSHTFSHLLDTIENAPLLITKKSCNNTSSGCKFPHVFESTELGHVMELENSVNAVSFASKHAQIRGQKSSLKLTLNTNKMEMYWVASSLSSRYTRAYSSQKLIVKNVSSVDNITKDDNYQTNSDLLTFTLANPINESTPQLNVSVELTLWHTDYAWSSEVLQIQRDLHPGESPTYVKTSAHCVFWNSSLGGWSSKGCRVVSSSSFSTTCVCNHLSVFSLMMQAHSYIGKSPFLLAITLILVLLLLAYLVAKIIMIKRKPSSNKHETNSLPDRSQLLKNFGLLLTLGVYGLIFFLVDKHYFALPPWACYGTGMVGHFLVHWAVLVLTLEFTVATVDYISLKGFHFLLVQTTRNPNRTMIGIPFWVALLSVAMVTIVDEYDGPDSLAYGGAYCWIDQPFQGSLFIPLWILLGFNYFLLILVFGESIGAARQQRRTLPSGMGRDAPVLEVLTFAKNGLLTNTLVTSTWIIAYFHLGPYDKGSKFLGYLFPIVFLVQGLLIERLMDKEALVGKLKKKVVTCLLKPPSLSQGKVYEVQETQLDQLGSSGDPNEKDVMLLKPDKPSSQPERAQSNPKKILLKTVPASGQTILARCLESIGCAQYLSAFTDNDIDFHCFKTLTRDELDTLLDGKMGPVKKIYGEIQRIRAIDVKRKLDASDQGVGTFNPGRLKRDETKEQSFNPGSLASTTQSYVTDQQLLENHEKIAEPSNEVGGLLKTIREPNFSVLSDVGVATRK